MPRPDHTLALPARMARVAIVAPVSHLREALVAVADAGTVEPSGVTASASGAALEALRRAERARDDGAPPPALSPELPDLSALELAGAVDLLAGEVELDRRAAAAVEHGSFAALVGWAPESELEALTERLAPLGAAAVELPRPPWLEPPTLIARKPAVKPFRPLVETYGPARYADVDPTPFAAIAFVLMFGMMFGDVAHGLLLALLALGLRRVRKGRLLPFQRLWPLPFAAGLSAAAFGLLYGEFFGPTGVVPTLWLDPVDEPVPLLIAAAAFGLVLLATSYSIGSVNRWREEGAAAALVAPAGIAGACVFVGGGVVTAGWYLRSVPLGIAGVAITLAGLALLSVGYVAHTTGGRAAATVQVSVEVTDSLIRTGTSVVSFTRLGAFGLMHAALGALVWSAVVALWGGPAGAVLAGLVFFLGTTLAFSLELLVAGVQALRLEYYELFSRIFAGEGKAFAPWHIPLAPERKEP